MLARGITTLTWVSHTYLGLGSPVNNVPHIGGGGEGDAVVRGDLHIAGGGGWVLDRELCKDKF